MFSIFYGSQKRDKKIRKICIKEPSTAVILAAVHFEWTIKRAILKLGISPTKILRDKLEKTINVNDYRKVWKDEVNKRFRNNNLGTIIGTLTTLQNNAIKIRGSIIHGNGTASTNNASVAVDQFLRAAEKIYQFAKSKDEDLDTKLKTRLIPRKLN